MTHARTESLPAYIRFAAGIGAGAIPWAGGTLRQQDTDRIWGIIMATTVAEVMTPAPETVGADEVVGRAAKIMRDIDVGAVVVTDDTGSPTGIVTDRDIAVRVIAEDRDPRQTPVREAASGDLETVNPATSLEDAAEIMRLRAVRRLPVVEGDQIVGVVSLGDLAREGDHESVLGQVSSMPGNR